MPPRGPPSDLGHNLQIPRSTSTRFPKYKFPKYKFSTDKYVQERPSSVGSATAPYFKASKGISRTSLHRGILTRFAIEIFFPTIRLTQESKEFIQASYVRGQLFKCPQPRIPFFLFTSSGVYKQPVSFEVLAPMFFILRGSHVQRQYQKRTTLRSKSSTIKGLLYAPNPDNRKKGTLSDWPQLSRVSSTLLLCCWGRSCSKL